MQKLSSGNSEMISRFKEEISYNPDNGLCHWKTSGPGRKPSLLVGHTRKDGYVAFCLDQQMFYLHRVAWAITYGRWPKETIDHINGNPSDNRLCNLREATYKENLANKKSGRGKSNYLGVSLSATNRWVAQLSVNGHRFCLGTYDDEIDAAKAYDKKAKEVHGEFASPNIGQ